MIHFKIEKQEIQINEKKVKFDFLISQIIFFNDCFYVLFEHMSVNENYGQSFNLYAVNLEGETIWIAELPFSPDCFLNIFIENDQLYAYSFSAYECLIDLETGKIKEKVFTK